MTRKLFGDLRPAATRAIFACAAFCAITGSPAPGTIHISLKHSSEAEQKTRDQLERILKAYDLSKYTFTQEIEIDERAIPHSHPILTLHTRHLNSDDQLLSTYVHEQLHWYLDKHLSQTDAAEAELRKAYPRVPLGYPEGAQDEESTYLHLIDCYLEMQADRHLMGQHRATEVMKFWAQDHYRWVYRTVLEDEVKIREILRRNHLESKTD